MNISFRPAHSSGATVSQSAVSRVVRGVCRIALFCVVGSCSQDAPQHSPPLSDENVARAEYFVHQASLKLEALSLQTELAEFSNDTDGTPEHAKKFEQAKRDRSQAMVALWKEAGAFADMALPPATARQIRLLRIPPETPPPFDGKLAADLFSTQTVLTDHYIDAQHCDQPPRCRPKTKLYEIMDSSRVPAALLSAWSEWHDEGAAIRDPFTKSAELLNVGARNFGEADAGAVLRSQYEMPPAAFIAEYDRLWNQVRPLYEALHCHVRAKLREHYGARVPEKGLIPAHLLGNMWGQYWQNIDGLLGIPQSAKPIDVTEALKDRKTDRRQMVGMAENFFRSMGFPELPKSFWELSLFEQPPDKKVKVNCQPMAWPINPARSDVRLTMCIEVKEDHFRTLHHELGHIYYYLAYAHQPHLFQRGANPGFHEAIGDTLALAITPDYLKQIGLIPADTPSDSNDLPYLMRVALEKVPALAMSIVVDTWRWRVFAGEIPPDRYNEGWWEQVRKYQGFASPRELSEKDFDAGMFYHVSYGVPYDRYFTAGLLQFDFYRALCKAAGYTGELHRCSFYGNKAAGDRLRQALALGASEPWPNVLQQLTGRPQIDGSALVEYLGPALTWLKTQNRGRQCGWE